MLMRFVGSNSQVYYDNGYLQFFQNDISFQRSIAMLLTKPQIMISFYLAGLVSVT